MHIVGYPMLCYRGRLDIVKLSVDMRWLLITDNNNLRVMNFNSTYYSLIQRIP